MDEIIWKNFNAWVREVGPEEAMIAVFAQVRDIPYYLVSQIEDPDEWAASILKTRKGSCSPKHYLLGLLFARLGIPVKYATYGFKWAKQPLKYPPDLRGLAEGSPIGYHVACKAYIKRGWVLVDATWDRFLEKAGFPVNASWDGVSDTVNAVIPLTEVIHHTPQERLNYVKEMKGFYTEQEKTIYAQFMEKFNLWLEGLRKK